MDFSWNNEQLELKEKILQFSQTLNDNLSDNLEERDHQGQFSYALWKKCTDFGILKLNLPKEYGGGGHDILTSVLAMETLGYGCRDNGLLLALNIQIWCVQQILLTFASEEQKQKYLPAIGSGELFFSQAMNEEASGSDALNMQTSAQKISGGYLLNGKKVCIGLAPISNYILVFASTDLNAGRWGISLFLVENNSQGCTITARDKMGTRTNPLGDLLFEDCFVSEANRIGPEGIGMSVFNHTMDWERSFILSSYVGTMAYQLEQTIKYAQNNKKSGQSIGKYQSISNRIADMKSRLEIARLLLYKQAWQKQKQQLHPLDSAVTKLNLSEFFLQSCLDTVRIHGSHGYLTEYGIERDLRDAMGPVIYAGTSDIQRNIIVKLLGL